MKRNDARLCLLLAAATLLTALSGCVPAEYVESLSTPVPTALLTPAPTAPQATPELSTPVPTPLPAATVAVTSAPTAAPTPTPEPVFTVKTVLSAGKNLPIVENCPAAKALNAGLAERFTPWALAAQQATAKGYPVSLQYSFYTKEIDHERFCILYPRLESAEGVYKLASLTFSPDSEDLPDYAAPAHEGFADPVYVQAAIRLAAKGVRLDAEADPDLLLTPETFFWELEQLYTLFTGRTPEAVGSELGDTAVARAAVLDLISAEQARSFAREAAADSGYTMEAQYLSAVLAPLTSRILRDRAGIYAETVSAGDGFDASRRALETWGYAAGLQDSADWQAVLARLPEASRNPGASLNRLGLASLYTNLYESAFGAIDEIQWTTLLDTEAVDARKAHAAYLMTSFPGSRYFSPAYPVAVHDLYEWTAQFVSGFSGRFLRLHPEAAEAPLTRRSLYAALGCWFSGVDFSEPATLTDEEVDNARDHDWYVSQYDGSAYAAANCMPAMTAMTLRWLDPTDPATPDSVRALSTYEGVAWRMRQVEEILQKENVVYFIRRLDLDQWVRDLDAGCLVLIQTNEGSLAGDGHCLILYGYRRYGESTTFLVMDPGYSTKTDLFGEPLGKGQELDARYVWLIASRFSSTNLSVRR